MLELRQISDSKSRIATREAELNRAIDVLLAQIGVHETLAKASTPAKPGPTIPQEGNSHVQPESRQLPAESTQDAGRVDSIRRDGGGGSHGIEGQEKSGQGIGAGT